MAQPTDRCLVVLTTTGSEEQAQALAGELVRRRLAACVNIVRNVSSVYRWKGEVAREEEQLLVIKTAERMLPQVKTAIRELHSYELPEIVALPIGDGDPEYLSWLSDAVR